MESIRCISGPDAASLLQETPVTIVDIRDPQSFAEARIPGAIHLSNQNLQEFLNEANMDSPVLVYCYHGISSQNAAAFLIERGFEAVYSLDGGFEAWRVDGAIER